MLLFTGHMFITLYIIAIFLLKKCFSLSSQGTQGDKRMARIMEKFTVEQNLYIDGLAVYP